jgi:hypothetical protein
MTKKEREQLINYLKYNRENNLDYVLTDEDTDMIIEALSAEPCPYYDTEVKTCRKSEVPTAEPCEDAISREEALECFPMIMQGELFTVATIRHQLKKLPPVKPQGDSISREAVNNVIETFFEEAQPYSLFWEWKNELKAKVNELLPVEPQEWISVKEHGNPKEDDDYYVTFVEEDHDTHDKWVDVDIEYFCVESQRWSNHNTDDDRVIAWMPVPSPYKGE